MSEICNIKCVYIYMYVNNKAVDLSIKILPFIIRCL